MSDTDTLDAARLMELARAQSGEPSDWSLATTPAWLERMYAGPDVIVRRWELPTGQLSAAAAVHMPARSRPAGWGQVVRPSFVLDRSHLQLPRAPS